MFKGAAYWKDIAENWERIAESWEALADRERKEADDAQFRLAAASVKGGDGLERLAAAMKELLEAADAIYYTPKVGSITPADEEEANKVSRLMGAVVNVKLAMANKEEKF